jgi:signal transduction histidine kinase
MFNSRGIAVDRVIPSDFDPPHAGQGALFPIGRGLLDAAGIDEDLLTGEVISATGRSNFIDAIMEFNSEDVDSKFLDVLCCDGCIMGSGMTTRLPMFKRRAAVARYTRQVIEKRGAGEWRGAIERFSRLDLNRHFTPMDQRISPPADERILDILARMGKFRPEDELNCGACGYETCRDHAIAIYRGLAESEMCLPYTIEKLHQTINELNDSHKQLADAREALIQSEKMASMGQLAAGIAHEVNNPLGVVLMYAHLLKEELDKGSDMYKEMEMVVEHADRAKKIVAGLLHFARQNKVILKPVPIEEFLHSCQKAIILPPNVTFHMACEIPDQVIHIDRDQMMQVMINLLTNAVAAMPDGGTLSVRVHERNGWVQIDVEDTGIGIPKENQSKIFEPFFTTKKVGTGTGLGLSVAYGIVKMHYGDIRFKSNPDPKNGPTGTIFTITLPKERKMEWEYREPDRSLPKEIGGNGGTK